MTLTMYTPRAERLVRSCEFRCAVLRELELEAKGKPHRDIIDSLVVALEYLHKVCP